MNFWVFNVDLFKRMIKGLYLENGHDPVSLILSGNLKVEMYNTKYSWGFDDDDVLVDDMNLRVVKLYAYKKGTLIRVWTDAFNEEHLLLCYQDIFSEIDRKLLTYNWDEFSSDIDSFLEQLEQAVIQLRKKCREKMENHSEINPAFPSLSMLPEYTKSE